FLALPVSRETGIYRKKRRRHRASRAEDEIDAGADHAHQQHDGHHAPHRRTIADLAPRFFNLHPDEAKNYCAHQPRPIFQAISYPRNEIAGKTAAAHQQQSSRDFGLERWQTSWFRNSRISDEHTLDSSG